MLEGPSRFFAAGPLEPIGGVRPMAGLLNRTRRFLDDDGAPRVLGLHAVGDSHTCTNPLYGRGCSLALVQALRLADALAAHGDDAAARADGVRGGVPARDRAVVPLVGRDGRRRRRPRDRRRRRPSDRPTRWRASSSPPRPTPSSAAA